jgi:hypothetical protein
MVLDWESAIDDTSRGVEVGWMGGILQFEGLGIMILPTPRFMEAFMIIGRSLECLGLHL